jgi:hypothetical protein
VTAVHDTVSVCNATAVDGGTVTARRGTVTVDSATVTARFHGPSRTNQEFHASNHWLPSVHPRRVSVVVHPVVHGASLAVHGTAPQQGIAGPSRVDTPGGRVCVHPASFYGP